MSPASSIRLFEADPDLIGFVSADERAEATQIEFPIRALPKGLLDVREVLERSAAFGAFVLDGMLLQSVRLGDHVGLRLVGPGDVLALTQAPRSALVVDATCRATVPTRLVLLERRLMWAARRWPQIVAGLHQRTGEQSERLMTQLMICQLPRVDDRLLALMWLLAESWGHVTATGTMLPLMLTHEALGGLIGARRSTVTLALGELTDAGAILRRDVGWLLLQRPAFAGGGQPHWIEDPRPLDPSGSQRWSLSMSPRDLEPTRAALRETIERLHQEHARTADQMRERFRRTAATREAVAKRRARAEHERVRRPRVPSA
jgi:hypothetical protein